MICALGQLGQKWITVFVTPLQVIPMGFKLELDIGFQLNIPLVDIQLESYSDLHYHHHHHFKIQLHTGIWSNFHWISIGLLNKLEHSLILIL